MLLRYIQGCKIVHIERQVEIRSSKRLQSLSKRCASGKSFMAPNSPTLPPKAMRLHVSWVHYHRSQSIPRSHAVTPRCLSRLS